LLSLYTGRERNQEVERQMNIDVRMQSADLKVALDTYIKRRLHFALGRFTGKLGRVSVRVEDVPGAGDVPNASCRIRVELLPIARMLRQEAVDRNLYVAIDVAIERIARTFERELDLVHSLGTVQNPESAASYSRKRRFK
jgi:ribosome-associated translation inhibitor RaiA